MALTGQVKVFVGCNMATWPFPKGSVFEYLKRIVI